MREIIAFKLSNDYISKRRVHPSGWPEKHRLLITKMIELWNRYLKLDYYEFRKCLEEICNKSIQNANFDEIIDTHDDFYSKFENFSDETLFFSIDDDDFVSNKICEKIREVDNEEYDVLYWIYFKYVASESNFIFPNYKQSPCNIMYSKKSKVFSPNINDYKLPFVDWQKYGPWFENIPNDKKIYLMDQILSVHNLNLGSISYLFNSWDYNIEDLENIFTEEFFRCRIKKCKVLPKRIESLDEDIQKYICDVTSIYYLL